MDKLPHPGDLGVRIYENVSKEGWIQWLERLTTIINENGLSTADPENLATIEKHMLGFFFDEGDYGGLPAGFKQAGGGKK
jgi:Fe-S cluster biosynthesis and repair protein YggX